MAEATAVAAPVTQAPAAPVAHIRRPRKKTASESQSPQHRVLASDFKRGYGRQHFSESEDYYIDDEYYDSFDLEEPFSSSDEEDDPSRARRSSKPKYTLPLPRRRIRTLSGTIPPVGYAPVWGGPTMCLTCLEFFDIPSETDKYVTHLLEKHRIVIIDIHLIVDLKRYIEFWRHRFGEKPIESYFPLIKPAPGDPLAGKVEAYYLMSEKVPEDMQIRERLALRRLEEVLSCQQRERDDKTFIRSCLFCRYRVKGNRAKLIHHLYTIHHLNLGSPDNLVFVNEYMDMLKYMLDNNQCLHCERFFPDHNTLMDHMRKKGHREVNPKNSYYDKFYVINYLELGKKWLEVLAEDFEDTMPTFVDSEDEEEEETWNEWQEDNTDENYIVIMCLFCDHTCAEVKPLLKHMEEEHKFDLPKVVKERHLSYYNQVKLINYIRKMSHSRACFVCGKADLGNWKALREHLAADDHLTKLAPEENWISEENLIPYFANDYLLCFLEDPAGESGQAPPLDADAVLASRANGSPSGAGNGIPGSGSGVVKPPADEDHPEDPGGSPAPPGDPKINGFRPPVQVIPEDLPEMSEILKDPALREDLM